MERFGGYTQQDCLDLTLPDMIGLLTNVGPFVAEPDWYVDAVRGTPDYKEKLLALKAYTTRR